MSYFPTHDVTDLLERISDLEIERDDLRVLVQRYEDKARTWKGLYEMESRMHAALINRVEADVKSVDELATEMLTEGV